MYQLLTAKGYRVFFAPTSLASVAGANYEAGIYHALHTAKVMLLVCSDAAHLVSPWVQSEWSRFLSLMNVDPDRRLVPLLYEHFSPSRLPEQLVYRNLQGLDMGQLNAKDNLLGLLQEVVGGDAPTDDPADPAVAPLLQRTRMFMEDGEWQKADEYAERVLDIAPENGAAYVCKLLIAFKCVKIADLASQPDRAYEERGDYRKAMRYADEATKKQLAEVGASIDARNEEKRLAGLYDSAVAMMGKKQWLRAAKRFDQLGDFRDAKAQAELCRQKEENHKAGIYAAAVGHMKVGAYQQAIQCLAKIGEYKDAKALADQCREKMNEQITLEKVATVQQKQEQRVTETQATMQLRTMATKKRSERADKATITFMSEGATGKAAIRIGDEKKEVSWGETLVVDSKEGTTVTLNETILGNVFVALGMLLLIGLIGFAVCSLWNNAVANTILAAVIGLFAVVGINEWIKSEEIKKVCRIRPGTDYRVFRNKSGLLDIEEL